MYKGAASWAGSAAACFTNTWICRAHYWSNWVDTIWSGSLSKNFTGVCQPFFQPSSPKKWAGQNQQMCLLGTSFGRFLSFSKLEFVNVRLHANVQARNYHTVSNHVENAPKKTLKPVLCMAYSCIGKTSSGRLDSAGCSLIHMTPCHPKGGKISAIIICCWTFWIHCFSVYYTVWLLSAGCYPPNKIILEGGDIRSVLRTQW